MKTSRKKSAAKPRTFVLTGRQRQRQKDDKQIFDSFQRYWQKFYNSHFVSTEPKKTSDDT